MIVRKKHSSKHKIHAITSPDAVQFQAPRFSFLFSFPNLKSSHKIIYFVDMETRQVVLEFIIIKSDRIEAEKLYDKAGGAIKRHEYNIICNLLDKVNNVEKYLIVLSS